jgi:hypothetical protein
MRRALGRKGPRLQLKMGEVVYKGHYSYELMNQLQLGIRYSVGRTAARRPALAAALAAALAGGGGGAAATAAAALQQQQWQQQVQQGGRVSSCSGGAEPLGPADFAAKLKVCGVIMRGW